MNLGCEHNIGTGSASAHLPISPCERGLEVLASSCLSSRPMTTIP